MVVSVSYLILSLLFSVGCASVLLEMYILDKPISLFNKIVIFALALITSALIWPLLLVIIDISVIWNMILRRKYGNAQPIVSNAVEESPAQESDYHDGTIFYDAKDDTETIYDNCG